MYDGISLAVVLGWYAAGLPGALPVGRLLADPGGYLAAQMMQVAGWYALIFAPARGVVPGAVLAECVLDDNTRVLGLVARYTGEDGKEGVRDLALSHAVVTDAGGNAVDAAGWHGCYVVVNGRQLRWWRVRYLTENAADRFRSRPMCPQPDPGIGSAGDGERGGRQR